MTDEVPIKRTEQEAVLRAPIEVTIGGRAYQVRPLRWRENLSWTDLCGRTLDERAEQLVGIAEHTNREMIGQLQAYMGQLLELVIAYDVDGTLGGREAVLDAADPREIMPAYRAIRRVAVPFDPSDPIVGPMVDVIARLTRSTASEASSPSSSPSSPASDPSTGSSTT